MHARVKFCIDVVFLMFLAASWTHAKPLPFAVLVSADTEWRAVKPLFAAASLHQSPYGEYFFADVERERVLFFHGGWGKVAAAGSTQYVIDQFHPARLINLGTCGGVEGRIKRFDVVAPERVVIYDIAEAMGDSEEAIAHYTTSIKLPAQFPVPVVRVTMYSADRDLTPQGLRDMDRRFRPVAVDWESGAIAWVAQRNHTPLLILRGVSDLVSPETGEAQGNIELFEANAARIMRSLVSELPKWIAELRRRPPA
jgi:adenosylhomocysteine nucleosidase